MLANSIKDKVVIVTGGTRGIGLATVKLFLKYGAKVVLCGSKKETVDNALNSIKEEMNLNVNNILGFYPNLLNIKEIKEMVEIIENKWGRIDVLINNAGISDNVSLYEQDDKHFAKVMDTNVQTIFNCTRIVAEKMKKQHSGVILNTSSMVSLYGQPIGVGYPTSKFAVNGLTKSLARELGKYGIRVNAIAPGVIETDMVKALDKEVINKIASGIPAGRLGSVDDIANGFLFLASDMASYISGAILSIDGAIVN